MCAQKETIKPRHFTVIGRTPLVEILCKNGCSAPAVLTLMEVPSVDNVFRTLRISFLHRVAECLGSFLSPHDTMRISNVHWPLENEPFEELVLGWKGTESFVKQSDSPTDCVELMIYRKGHTIPAVIEICEHNMDIFFQYLPNWANHFNIVKQSSPKELSEGLWNFYLEGNPQKSSNITFTHLVYLQEGALANFFACVVEIRLCPRSICLPNVGQVFTMNLTVVDPSIAESYKAGLLPANPFRLSIMLIAYEPQGLPFITCGDIIRVYHGAFYVTQDMRTRVVYMNCRSDARETRISLWSIRQLACTPPESTDKQLTTAMISPFWSSYVPQFPSTPDQRQSEVQSLYTDLPHMWEQVTSLSLWAAESLYTYYCFRNEYTASLTQAAEFFSKRHCDLLVYTLSDISQGTQLLRQRTLETTQSMASTLSHSLPLQMQFHANKTGFPNDTFLHKTPHPIASSTACSLCLHVYDGNDLRVFPHSSRAVLLHLVNLSSAHFCYLSRHINKGDWLLLRNVLLLTLCPAVYPHTSTVLDVYELDASRCRCVKIPSFSKDVRHLKINE